MSTEDLAGHAPLLRELERMERENGRQASKAALADAVVREEIEEGDDVQCLAFGPGGECRRLYGHVDKPLNHGDDHHSWDMDHFVSWPVGWKSEQQRLVEAEARIAELETRIAELEAGHDEPPASQGPLIPAHGRPAQETT